MAVSLRDIAREVGLSSSTVSLALRGVGRMTPETREKVLTVAREMGYRPHPLLARAFSLMRQPEEQRYRETLAFITEWEPLKGHKNQKETFNAALDRANSLGYKLENFVLSGNPAEHRRLSRKLRAQGIRGVIIDSRLSHPQPRLYLEWRNFAAVELGQTLWHPRNLHHIGTAGYKKTLQALHLLKRVGYRRIGMAVEPAQNRHHHGVYFAAYLYTQLRQAPKNRMPIFDSAGPWTEASFQAWVRQYQPDVLYIHAVMGETIRAWLAAMNLRVPEDISLFCANAQDEHWSGLRRDCGGIGRAGVEMVSLLVAANELGIPRSPRSWICDEFWQPGKTLRQSIEPYITPEGELAVKATYNNPIKCQ